MIMVITAFCKTKAKRSVFCQVTSSRSHSDTDTLKAAYQGLGISGAETNLIQHLDAQSVSREGL